LRSSACWSRPRARSGNEACQFRRSMPRRRAGAGVRAAVLAGPALRLVYRLGKNLSARLQRCGQILRDDRRHHSSPPRQCRSPPRWRSCFADDLELTNPDSAARPPGDVDLCLVCDQPLPAQLGPITEVGRRRAAGGARRHHAGARAILGLADVAHCADSALREVAHVVAGHGRKVVAEERLERHGRLRPLHALGHRLEPALALLG